MTTTSEIKATKKAQHVFEQALDLPEAERLDYIESQCGDDKELLEQVKHLLDNEPRESRFIEKLFGTPNQPDAGFRLVGETLGVYRLTKKLGRGGMAEVYLAQRTDGVYENKVAVKVIQGIGQHQNLITRFHRERKILANLKHPNIAQLLDGGSTDTGLPYFVMEYVQGERIDAYCQHHQLSVRERLKLFIKVCSAVTFAHRNLVIHRDLKPANILVDKTGEPKLLDFGIAKLLDQDREPDATVTELAMTPHYASPEQLRGEVLTTTSDVYSLGVLLYELLVGVRPNQITNPFLGVQREEIESNILRPSKAVLETKTSTTTEGSTEPLNDITKTGRIKLKKLSRALQGDLDTIVLKLLRREPERRYASVQALADDLERYLTSLPILARKDSLWYRAHRFVRRNAAMISVVSLAVITVSISIGLQQYRVTKERDIAVRERNKFKETQDFLIGLFNISDPGESRGNNITAREILDRGVENIQQELEHQPEAKSELLTTMGVVYKQLGLYDTALPLLRQALEIREQIFSLESTEIADSRYELGDLFTVQGEYSEAKHLLHQALTTYQKSLGDNHIKTADSYERIGIIQDETGKYDLAVDYYKKALAIKLAKLGGDHFSFASIYNNLGIVFFKKSEYDLATDYYKKALDIRLKTLGENHISVSYSYHNLGVAFANKAEYDLAIDYYKKALVIKLKSLGDDHLSIAETYGNLGVAYEEKEEYDLAIDYYKKTLVIMSKSLGDDHPNLAITYNNLGLTFFKKAEYDRALEYHNKALVIKLNSFGNDHPSIAHTYNNIGNVYNKKGEYDRAIYYFEKSLPIFSNTLTDNHPWIADSYHGLGEAHSHKNEYRLALDYYKKAYSIRVEKFGLNDLESKKTEIQIAEVKNLMLESK